MSLTSLAFSCRTRLWCILWKSRSLRKRSHVELAFLQKHDGKVH